MKLIKRFILFLSIFLLVVPIHQTARAYQYGRNCVAINPAAQCVGAAQVSPPHIIQHRRAYITSAPASHSRKPDGTHNPADANRGEEDQAENEEDEPGTCKKQVKQAYYFITPFCTPASSYFDNCIRSSISLGMLSYTSSYRYILYNVIRI